ncbi:MAG: hypothetical protein UY16_C0013G0013 [Candidatus Gottesmanbacteria bacterium GW2011_GWA2_47_9]|uniref:Uncharacterized protein n=1 Tax=Candidatus Gottesmanbacteria bacterium GW2011_GWA2_47_9 TaxID=1618445 RepID=A0A0G1WCR8_9BACT|nr:MAG: hypothetical protein UY16_C0013G0013 [Candidatus Gottesmanbacteria bacterium GW2011_GWA2_47_9]
MNIDCCMITTNLQSRLQLMQNCVASVEKQCGVFSKKILSVDEFPGGVSTDWYDTLRKKGWTVLSKKVIPRGSMVLNQYRVVSAADSDIVLYTEDDIVINRLPKTTTIHKLFTQPMVHGKRAGFICFNTHVWKRFTQNPKHIMDFIHDLGNYIIVDGDVFLVKRDVMKDKYFLNFPAALTTKNMFLALQEYAFAHNVGWGTEQAMTSAWFELGKDKENEVLISLKPEIIDHIKSGKRITVLDFYNYANINFWNNDVTLRHPETPGRREGCGIVENMFQLYENL